MGKNTIELNEKDFELDFLSGETEIKGREIVSLAPYIVVIADDDDEMHQATKLLLKNFTFEGRKLQFIDTYTGDETIRVLNETPEIAVILLDVVMESKVAGLEVVDYIRKIQENHIIRIILRTGQPGEAPENKVIADYDINDYRLKSELTAQRLFTSMYEALRSYRDIMVLEHSRAALAKMIKMSSNLFSQQSMEDLYTCILDQLLCSKDTQPSAVYFREVCEDCGLVFLNNETFGTIIAATGRYSNLLGQNIRHVPELQLIQKKAADLLERDEDVFSHMEQGYLISKSSYTGLKSFIYIESRDFNFDIEMIKEYLTNYSSALDNYLMNQELIKDQKELIELLVRTIDTRCSDIGHHVIRVGKIAGIIAKELNLNDNIIDILSVASRLHDVNGFCFFASPATHYTEGCIDLEEFEIIKKAAIITGHSRVQREKEGYPLGVTKIMLIQIAKILYLADQYDMERIKNSNFELKRDAFKEKANGLFDDIVWNGFINNLDAIDAVIKAFPD